MTRSYFREFLVAKLNNVAEVEREKDEKEHCQLILSSSFEDPDSLPIVMGPIAPVNQPQPQPQPQPQLPAKTLAGAPTPPNSSPTLTPAAAADGTGKGSPGQKQRKPEELSPFPGIRLHMETDSERFFVDKADDICVKRERESLQKEAAKREKHKKAEGMLKEKLLCAVVCVCVLCVWCTVLLLILVAAQWRADIIRWQKVFGQDRAMELEDLIAGTPRDSVVN